MVGILSYGAYIPMWRIERATLANASGGSSMGGERSVASWDEDSLTMAVEAGLDCLKDTDPKEIDGLFFATVSSPFEEKQVAATIASALDLRKDMYTCDVTTSLRAGTSAIKAAFDAVKTGSAKRVLVTVADCRSAMPRSTSEQIFGDGAAAFLIGEGEVIAEIEGFTYLSNAVPGTWKREGDSFPLEFQSKLDRGYGLLKDVPEAVRQLTEKCKVEVKDISKSALHAPDPRGYIDIARSLRIEPKTQLQDSLFAAIGITGTPHCLLLLVSALETAKTNEKIICSSWGEGSDAFLITTTKEIEQIKGKHKGTGYISSKRMLPYGRFADFKRIRETDWPDTRIRQSVIKYWRNEKWEQPLYGMRCNKCGTLQYPVARCCMMCGEKDNHEEVKLAKKGKVFTYCHDYLMGCGMLPADGINPCTRVIVTLEDGCRMWLEMSDCYLDELAIDMPMELTFRLFHQKEGFRFYNWRARPTR